MVFLDRLVAYRVATIERELAAGADVIMCYDDWGTQTAPIISPELFRDVFKPRYAAMFAPPRGRPQGLLSFLRHAGADL
ncbi:MAG: hypothetical protein ABIF71_12940 [Planctomycetota bacterium]